MWDCSGGVKNGFYVVRERGNGGERERERTTEGEEDGDVCVQSKHTEHSAL